MLRPLVLLVALATAAARAADVPEVIVYRPRDAAGVADGPVSR